MRLRTAVFGAGEPAGGLPEVELGVVLLDGSMRPVPMWVATP